MTHSYKYIASGTGTAAAMTLPTPGSKLTSASVTFQWNKGVGITNYTLMIGSTSGASDIDKITTTSLSASVTNLPTNGETLYITLVSLNGNTNLKRFYTYVAPGSGTAAVMTSPTPGSKLDGANATFTWTTGDGITNYTLLIGTTAGASDIDNITTTNTSASVTNLPTNGATLYVTLSSLNGKSHPSHAYTYIAAGP